LWYRFQGISLTIDRHLQIVLPAVADTPFFRVPKSANLLAFPIQDGVMLGADTRATEGPIVADPNCQKIHRLAANIYACGAGTAADCDHVTGLHLLRPRLIRFAARVCALDRLKLCR
jgi:20S proteasome subunit beta 2